MKTLTQKQLKDLLMECVGAKAMTFTASTEPEMYQKINPDGAIIYNPYWNRARRITKTNVMVGVKYIPAVERQLEREDKPLESFQKGTSWHQPILNNGKMTPLCTNKNSPGKKIYLRAKREKMLTCKYINPLTGRPIPKERIEPFIKMKRSYENQGTDKKIELYTVDLANILEVKIDKETFKIVE